MKSLRLVAVVVLVVVAVGVEAGVALRVVDLAVGLLAVLPHPRVRAIRAVVLVHLFVLSISKVCLILFHHHVNGRRPICRRLVAPFRKAGAAFLFFALRAEANHLRQKSRQKNEESKTRHVV